MPIDRIITASIQDGAVVAADLAAGVPTRTQLPSGTVLQVQALQWSTESKRTGTLQNYIDAPGSSIAITTSVLNSRILAQIQVQSYNDNPSCSANVGLRRDSTRLVGIDGGSGNSWAGHGAGYSGSQRMALNFFDTPNVAAGTVLTYVVLHGHWQGTGITWFNYSEGTYTNFSTITLMEIAP